MILLADDIKVLAYGLRKIICDMILLADDVKLSDRHFRKVNSEMFLLDSDVKFIVGCAFFYLTEHGLDE